MTGLLLLEVEVRREGARGGACQGGRAIRCRSHFAFHASGPLDINGTSSSDAHTSTHYIALSEAQPWQRPSLPSCRLLKPAP